MFKFFLLGLAFLFLAMTAVSLLIPSHVRISKAINIHRERNYIYRLISERENWPKWNPAFMSGKENKFTAITSTLISKSDSLLIINWQQGNKAPVKNSWQFLQTMPDSLTLQWYMDFYSGWLPWQKLGSLFYEDTYGILMEKGLTNLKNVSETQ